MSQSPETETLTLPAAEPTEPDAATLVDAYAEHLMDTLFEDVDRLLEGGEALPASSSELAPLSAETGDETALTATSNLDRDLDILGTTALEEAPLPASPAQPAPKRRWLRLSWETLLVLVTLSAAAGLGVLWAISQQRLNQAVPAADASAATQTAQPNAEFLNYLQRSLEVIANRSGSEGEAATGADIPNVAVLPGTPMVVPPAPVGMGAIQGSQAPINVIERVYIPYQATPNPSQPPTAAAPAPSGQAQQPQNTASAAIHTLVGVLELGSRSAALFEVNGVPQRIYIGERIGSSGWSLVSVSNEEAVIRRNGEVRSVYIGQKF